jgi:ABC-type glycerol-3-phosphate transport system substrate-binding protein
MIKKIILGVLALLVLVVVGFCIAAAMQPNEVKVTRSTVIAAPPEKVFEQVNDFTIAESHPSGHIKIDLEFIKPWEQRSVTDFSFKPEGDKTNVTWTMSMQNNFIGKAFGLLMDMDKMLGSDFEKGLAQMKTVAEAAKE